MTGFWMLSMRKVNARLPYRRSFLKWAAALPTLAALMAFLRMMLTANRQRARKSREAAPRHHS